MSRKGVESVEHSAVFEWSVRSRTFAIPVVFDSAEDYDLHLKDGFTTVHEVLNDDGYEGLADADWWAVVEYDCNPVKVKDDTVFIPKGLLGCNERR